MESGRETAERTEGTISVQGPFQRWTAVKIRIKELQDGQYVQEEDGTSSYLQTAQWGRLYRFNLMATVLQKESRGTITDLLLDDGSGKILLRSFGEDLFLSQVNVGDAVMVIGRMRRYGAERYVAAEIVRKIPFLWLKVRSWELPSSETEDRGLLPEREERVDITKVHQEKIPEESEELLMAWPRERIARLIQELDRGEGVFVEELAERLPGTDIEHIIEAMLKKGELFQISPGKVKTL